MSTTDTQIVAIARFQIEAKQAAQDLKREKARLYARKKADEKRAVEQRKNEMLDAMYLEQMSRAESNGGSSFASSPVKTPAPHIESAGVQLHSTDHDSCDSPPASASRVVGPTPTNGEIDKGESTGVLVFTCLSTTDTKSKASRKAFKKSVKTATRQRVGAKVEKAEWMEGRAGVRVYWTREEASKEESNEALRSSADVEQDENTLLPLISTELDAPDATGNDTLVTQLEELLTSIQEGALDESQDAESRLQYILKVVAKSLDRLDFLVSELNGKTSPNE